MPTVNATVVQKLIDAGAIIIGKTNMSELAFMASTSISAYGTVKNSFNAEYTAYGSSGGSAAAVSLNFVPIALGTDTNSSVRVPASANNVVGIRPTLGLVSKYGVLPYDINRDTVGVITKYVKDNATVLGIIDGYDTNDSRSDSSQEEYDYKLNTSAKSLDGYSIGVVSSFLNGSSNKIKDLMQKAITVLEEHGATIKYIDNFYTSDMQKLGGKTVTGYTFCDNFNNYIENKNGTIKSFSALTRAPGHTYSLWGYYEDCNARTSYMDVFNANRTSFQGLVNDSMDKSDVDVIIYPTTSSKLVKLSQLEDGLYKSYSYYIVPPAVFPSISVPLGFDSDNLPYGMEILSTKYDEPLIYEIASTYQKYNNTVKNPDGVPDLYEISDTVKELTKSYEELLNQKCNRKTTLEKISNYFATYSENENREEDAKELLKLCNRQIEINKSGKNTFVLVVYVLMILTLVRVLIPNNKNIHKKKRT